MVEQNPNTKAEAVKDQTAANNASQANPPNSTVKPTADGAQRPAAPPAPTRAGVVQNPQPTVDPDAPRAPEPAPEALPQSTLEEMEAGRRALARNKPTATAIENARAEQAAPAKG